MNHEQMIQMELEFPVVKWNSGEEFAVFRNKSGIPIKKIPEDQYFHQVEFLKQFDNADEALDYQQLMFEQKVKI